MCISQSFVEESRRLFIPGICDLNVPLCPAHREGEVRIRMVSTKHVRLIHHRLEPLRLIKEVRLAK
jgi:hypothetical protein